jgi:hypothetical protein
MTDPAAACISRQALLGAQAPVPLGGPVDAAWYS